MKIYTILFLVVMSFMSCNETKLKDPAEVHPPEEAVPDSMEIKNDSVITPEE